jgi:hypothetical protein
VAVAAQVVNFLALAMERTMAVFHQQANAGTNAKIINLKGLIRQAFVFNEKKNI